MSRTYRRKEEPQWVLEAYPTKRERWEYHRDRGINWLAPWSRALKDEANSKRRSHFAQELAKWMKDPDHPIAIHRKYGNPWNWD